MSKSIVQEFIALIKNHELFSHVNVVEKFPAKRAVNKYPAIVVSSANLKKTKPFSENSDVEISLKVMAAADRGGLYLENMVDDVVKVIMNSDLMSDVVSLSTAKLTYNSSNETLNQTITAKIGVVEEGFTTLLSLQFWDVSWNVNPENLRIFQSKNLRENSAPFGTNNLQNLGNSARVFHGEDEFRGEGALTEFLRISNMQRNNLSHPLRLFGIFAPVHAFFTKFELRGSLTPNLVKYSFEFVEDLGRPLGEGPSDTSLWSHRVQEGETIFSIAELHRVSVEYLVRLNSNIVDFANLVPGVSLWVQ